MLKNIKNIKMQKDSKNIYTRFTWYGFILIWCLGLLRDIVNVNDGEMRRSYEQ